jgi:hypothetical protein
MKHLIFISALALFSSCSSTRVVSSWTKPNTNNAHINRIVVLALTGNENNRNLRRQMEQSIVDNLQKNGYIAISAYAEYGPQEFSKNEEDAAVSKFKQSNADAVLTIVLLDKNKEQNYVPGQVNYYSRGVYYNRFWGYYGTMYDRVYTPGYYETNTRYFWEANLYDLGNSEMIYSIQTESFDPASTADLAQDNGRKIVKDMLKKGALQAR